MILSLFLEGLTLSNVSKLDTGLVAQAEEFAAKRWGWKAAPQEILDQAIMCTKIVKQSMLTGKIIIELGLVDADRVESLLIKRREEESSLKTLDYILEAETSNRELQENQNQILAYANSVQFFKELPTPDIEPHNLMLDNQEVASWCKKAEAVLMEIQKNVPVLVFAKWSRDAQRFSQMGKVEARSNPITKALDSKILVGLSTADNIASVLSAHKSGGANNGEEKLNLINHREWSHDAQKSRNLLANIHEFAIQNNCTDIHIGPQTSGDVRIEFRIDKQLVPAGARFNMTSAEYHEVKADLAFFSGATPQRELMLKPRDGSYTYMMGKVRADIRAVFIPKGTEESAKQNLVLIRLRVLMQENSGPIDLEKINMPPHIIQYMQNAVRPSSGLVLMVGPTGSGKSTNVLGMINEHVKLYKEELSRLSIEDPIERNVPNLDQVQVAKQVIKETKDPYAYYLPFMLRADPDLFFLGEIRSEESAIAAANFSDTGHLVLSTLHSQSAPKAINRLANMVPNKSNLYSVIYSLNYVFASRGLQRLCDNCKEVREVTVDESENATNELKRKGEMLNNIPTTAAFKSATGCSDCNYKGSVGILPAVEVLEVTPEVRNIALENMNESLKIEKMNELRHTTLYQEINRLIIEKKVSFKNLLV